MAINLGTEAPVIVEPGGGRHSDTGVRCDLIPARAILSVAEVLDAGARKYGIDNWRGIGVDAHLNHILTHIFAYLSGDKQDDHLSHAACRGLMALEVELNGEVNYTDSPTPDTFDPETDSTD